MDCDKPLATLVNREDRYRLLVESIVDYAIYMLDPQGRITSWNKGAQRFKGYTDDEIIGEHFSRFYAAEDQVAGLPALALRISEQEGRFEQEGWRVRKDGTKFWAHVLIDPIWDDRGTLIGHAKITRDLSPQRDAKEALRQSEQRFRLLVQAVQDYAIYMLDPKGRITSWNKGAQRFKGYTDDEIIGEHFSRFYTAEDRALGLPGRALQTAARAGRFEAEGWRVRKDGTQFWANVVIDPIHGEQDELIGFAKITRDITERREAQQALEETRVRFAQSQKMEAVGQLTGGVAHDFNNLLTVIKSSTDLLKRSDLSEERRIRYIGAISDTVDRAAKLTGQLLAFARRQALRPEVFDANQSVKAIGDMVGTLTGARIDVAIRIGVEPCFINADPSQFDTALVNMAVNARDAMKGEGRLTITVGLTTTVPAVRLHSEQVGKFVQIAFMDTGAGIAPAQIDRIFEPFFTTKGVGQGTGLGLSQVFGFAKQSGGEILVESEVGHGTTFTLYLPHVPNGGDLPKPSVFDEPTVDGRGTCVLVVEDNRQVGTFSTQTLQELGYGTHWVENAEDALSALAETPHAYDVVFSDVVMPGMNGVELGREIGRLYPGLPFVLTSGYSHVLALESDHGFELLQKPYSVEQLSRLLCRAATRKRSK